MTFRTHLGGIRARVFAKAFEIFTPIGHHLSWWEAENDRRLDKYHEAYQEGQQAFRTNGLSSNCPYAIDSHPYEREAWFEGMQDEIARESFGQNYEIDPSFPTDVAQGCPQ